MQFKAMRPDPRPNFLFCPECGFHVVTDCFSLLGGRAGAVLVTLFAPGWSLHLSGS